MTYEFHAMSAKSARGVQGELTRRSAEGWELIEVYGMKGTFGEEHVLTFRRPKT
jgi:hypothetical protein